MRLCEERTPRHQRRMKDQSSSMMRGAAAPSDTRRTPRGGDTDASGQLGNVDALAALLPSFPYEFWICHRDLSNGRLLVASFTQWPGWRQARPLSAAGLCRPFTIAALVAPVEVVVGDLSARGPLRPAHQICPMRSTGYALARSRIIGRAADDSARLCSAS